MTREELESEVERLRAELDTLIVQADKVVRDHAEHFREQERAAAVAWLRREMQPCSGPVRGTLAHAANEIECGKHRREEAE